MTSSGVYQAASADVRSRYPGTAPFSDSPADRARFFGREDEADTLYLRVLSVPLLVQFGKSGLGKTSLLQAGLFPRLRDRGKAFLPVMVRLNDPQTPLVAAVLRSFEESCATEQLELNVGDASSLSKLLSTTIVWRGDLLLAPVLVFDQFEEVFTLHDAAYRDVVAAELGAIATRSEAKIVISLREDYLGALEEFSSAIPGLFQERLRLEAMREDAAREAITRPARLVAAPGEQPYWSPQFELEPAALDRMIVFLKGSSGVIEPFQLQLLCRRAERLAVRRQKETGAEAVTLTVEDYGETVQFEAVLKNFYRETLAKVTPPSQRTRAARLCEEGLLGESGHRLMLEERQLHETYGVTDETLATLGRERLIVREPRHRTFFYEISHDRLAESIFAGRRRKIPAKVRRLLWAAVLLVAIVFAALVQWNRNESAKRRAIQRERDRAESLLTFLLGEDFFGEVLDSGRSTMLAQVQAHVGEGGGSERNTALARRGAAELRMVQGNVGEAVKLYRQALAMFEHAGSDVDTTRDVARTHERLALALEKERQFRDVRSHYDAADAAWVRVGRSGAATHQDCLTRAEMLTSSAYAKHQMGEQALATADLDKSVAIVFDVLFGGNTHCTAPPATPQPYPPARALVILSAVAGMRSFQYGTDTDADASVRLIEEARKQNPASASIRQELIAAIAERGSRQKSAKAMLDDYLNGLGEAEELRQWDPENRIWQRERAVNELLVSEAIVLCNAEGSDCKKPIPTLDDAEAVALDALATLRGLSSLDGSNRSLHADVSWGLQTIANIHAAAGRHEESLRRLGEAQAMLRASRGDSADAEIDLLEATVLTDIGVTSAALGLTDRAAGAVKAAIDILERLVMVHPGNDTYLAVLINAYTTQEQLCRQRGDAGCASAAGREIARVRKTMEALGQRVEKVGTAGLETGEAAELIDGRSYTQALPKLRAAAAAVREYLRLDPTLHGWYGRLRSMYEYTAIAHRELKDEAGYTAALVAQMNAAQIEAWLAPDQERQAAERGAVQARLALGTHLRDSSPRESLAMFQEVIGDLERLSAQLPRDAGIASLLGRAKCGAGQVRRQMNSLGWEEEMRSGLIDLRRATDLAPNDAEAFRTLGLCYRYLVDEARQNLPGEKAEGIKALRRALELDPGDQQARQALSALMIAPR